MKTLFSAKQTKAANLLGRLRQGKTAEHISSGQRAGIRAILTVLYWGAALLAYQLDGVAGLIIFGMVTTLGLLMVGNGPLSQLASYLTPKLSALFAQQPQPQSAPRNAVLSVVPRNDG